MQRLSSTLAVLAGAVALYATANVTASEKTVSASRPATPVVPHLDACAQPEWPEYSLRMHQQGTVTLRYLIGADGAVRETDVLQSSGYILLDLAAAEALGKCKFQPATLDGKAIDGWSQVSHSFTLPERDAEAPPVARMLVANVKPVTLRDRSVNDYWLSASSAPAGGYQPAPLADLEKAADQGDAKAQLRVAQEYINTSKDPVKRAKALEWLRHGAEQGDVHAQQSLAFALMRTSRRGGNEGNAAEAGKWMARAAGRDDRVAQSFYGTMLMEGQGVAADREAGFAWLTRAAQSGYGHGQAVLAKYLLKWHPERGGEALAWLRKGAEQDNALALTMLGDCYRDGRLVERDSVSAFALYQRAAKRGDWTATRGLADFYERGAGVKADPARARLLRTVLKAAVKQASDS